VRVALVAGPSRAGRCGVGDYTACLAKALNARGVESAVVSSGNWSLAGVCQTSSELRKSAFDLVHVQYPTVGFGTKLGPQGLALLRSSSRSQPSPHIAKTLAPAIHRSYEAHGFHQSL
jgi:hypothetical protein